MINSQKFNGDSTGSLIFFCETNLVCHHHDVTLTDVKEFLYDSVVSVFAHTTFLP